MANPIAPYGRRAGWLNSVPFSDFSGGLNTRDSPSEVAENETPDAMNVTLDEHGGVVKRLGKTQAGSNMPGAASNEFYSQALGLWIIQIGATLYKTADFTTYTSFKVLSSSAVVGMVDFNGQLVYVHQADGVFTYDGTTNTNRTAAIKGNCVAAWQNKVLVAGDPAKPSLVTCSATGDATGWTVGAAGCAQNQLREKDDTLITCLGVGQGEDIAGRPGCLAFKGESAYRINDSGTLAYVTIDGSYGAAGPLAVATLGGTTVVFNKKGLFTVDPGGTTAMTSVGDKIQNVFTTEQIAFSQLGLVAAGVYRDRVVFSFPWGSSATANTRTLEYHPTQGWIMWHDLAFAAFTTANGVLYGASPTAAKSYTVFTGWSDDGAAITCRYRTHEIEPANGYQCHFRRARIFARGLFDVYTLLDMDGGTGVLSPVTISSSQFIWNDPATIWNNSSMIWGPTGYEGSEDLWELGTAKSISFMFRESSTNAASGPALLEDGAAPAVGAIAVYQILLEYVQLGYS